MSEAILKALMRLFALIIDIDEAQQVSEQERTIIRTFLSRLLSIELVEKYMEVFEEYLHLYHQDRIDRGSVRDRKRTSLTAVRILGICEKINEELEQKQKIYVIVQLIEYLAFGLEIAEKELDFLETVATAFNIPEEEYHNILYFAAFSKKEIPDKKQVLVVNNETEGAFPEIHHIQSERLTGEISFLNVESVQTFLLRYHGKEDLYLNGQVLNAGTSYVFEHGSSLRGGNIETIYHSDVAGVFSKSAITTRISLVARDVEFRFRNSENGIHTFNIQEESGNLVGIMGGSGVGKSTLLNVLNGNLKPLSGEILINGYDLHDPEDRLALDGVIGFIPQDDLLLEDLTVYQNLYYSAKLCLDGYDEEQLQTTVDRVLMDLDLYEIRDLKVGKPLSKVISGGQRKRVNIALELIREPSILFVDEPTSGLSSVDSEMVMNLLKEQVHKGRLVIVNIHQPSSDLYKMFDRIIFMDRGGYQIFYGNPLEAVIYFKTLSKHANAREDQCVCCGNVDPDQVLQIIEAKIVNEHGRLSRTRKMTPKEWFTHFRKSRFAPSPPGQPKSVLPENHYSLPRAVKQMKIFFTRDLLGKLTNRQYVLISMLEAPLLAVILGFFTKYSSGVQGDPGAYVFRNNENLPAFLLMSVIVFLFLGLTISSEEIIKDRKIMQRESFLNLRKGAYLNSKVLIMFIISAIQSLSYVLVGNLIFEIRGMLLPYWLILFSTSCFANLLGLNISSGLNSVITIYILVPFLLIPQILFSGVLVKFDKLHKTLSNHEYVPVIGDLMTSRWAYEALTVEQFRNNRFSRLFFPLEQAISQAAYVESFQVPILQECVNECLKYLEDDQKQELIENNLRLLGSEIPKLIHVFPDIDAPPVDPENGMVPEREGLEELGTWLEAVGNLAGKRRGQSSRELNLLKQQVMIEHGGIAGFSAFRDAYENLQLSELVLNKNALEKKAERKGPVLVRNHDPAYHVPLSKWGRAQLYAPCKRIGNLYVSTLLFNVIVIWFSSILLYLTLRHDTLRLTLAIFDKKK